MIVLFDKLRHQPAPLPAVGHWDETLSANYNSGGEPALAGCKLPMQNTVKGYMVMPQMMDKW